jgi:GNAT superfamily N-acetyltransferase
MTREAQHRLKKGSARGGETRGASHAGREEGHWVVGGRDAAPMLSATLAWRLEQADTHYTESRLGGIQSRQGNPFGVEIWSLGRATAFICPAMAHVGSFNRVVGLNQAGAARLPELMGAFRSRDLPARVELLPGDLTPDLGRRLHLYGLRHTGFLTTLYGVPRPQAPTLPSGIHVRAATSTDVDLFIDLFLAGYDYPAALRETARDVMRFWYGCPGWRLYLGVVEGLPASVAVMYMDGAVAYLAAAATVPQFRGRGCHRALIEARLADAAEDGCELVAAQCTPLGSAQGNLERAGLRIAYTKAVWTGAHR